MQMFINGQPLQKLKMRNMCLLTWIFRSALVHSNGPYETEHTTNVRPAATVADLSSFNRWIEALVCDTLGLITKNINK